MRNRKALRGKLGTSRRLALGASLALLSPHVDAGAAVYRPAQFAVINGLETLDVAVGDLPEGESAAAIRCQGFVEVDGTLTDYFCVSSDMKGLDALTERVIAVVGEETFVPASVDGIDVRVLMNFSVLVQCDSTFCRTIPVRHHGYYLDQYGFNYVAPQPILPSSEWYEGYYQKLHWLRGWMPDVARIDRRRRYPVARFTMSAAIDAQGVASDGRLEWAGSGTTGSRQPLAVNWRARHNMERSAQSLSCVRYVPGFHDGQPTPMRYYEGSVTQANARRRLGDPCPRSEDPGR